MSATATEITPATRRRARLELGTLLVATPLFLALAPHDRYLFGRMRMCIINCWGTMGCPSCVANTNHTSKRCFA